MVSAKFWLRCGGPTWQPRLASTGRRYKALMIQDHSMRPNATRRDNWVQFAIGAAALLLPPLALGAAFYSMLADDEDVTQPAAAQTVAPPVKQPPVVLPATVGAESAGSQPPAGKSAEGATRTWERLPGQESPSPGQASPIRVAATPAVTVNPPATVTANPPADAEGGVTAPAAESRPAPAAPKRNVHRHAQPQQDPFPVRTWLQQIGILPRNAKDTRG
jgi:hypothetical protein